MQTYFFLIAALLYAGCAFLPVKLARVIASGTALAWLIHGGTLWADFFLPATLRVGFARRLSAA